MKKRGICVSCKGQPPVKGKTRCQKCADKESKRRSDYNKRTNGASEYYKHNTPQYRNWYYLRKYEITLEQYEEQLKKQDSLCAICHQPQKNNRRLDVDHDHITKKLRGLLCASCNTAIGHLRENKEHMLSAIRYLDNGGYKP